MSGSGGNGGPHTPPTPCDEIEINTQIGSPKPAALKGVKVGDVLQVELEKTGNISHVVVKRNGQVAGGLATQRALQLRDCMEDGHEYEAKVTAIAGGQYSVTVAAK